MAGKNVVGKLIDSHRAQSGDGSGGRGEALIKIDQTLTQDTTGTMAYLQFEALGVDRVKTERSVSYVDHNVLQVGFENADDHNFLQDIAAKYGIIFSRPGTDLPPGPPRAFRCSRKTLLGADSHTRRLRPWMLP